MLSTDVLNDRDDSAAFHAPAFRAARVRSYGAQPAGEVQLR